MGEFIHEWPESLKKALDEAIAFCLKQEGEGADKDDAAPFLVADVARYLDVEVAVGGA